MTKRIVFFLICFQSLAGLAQHSIKGVVIDESQQPIESANIYFDGTTFGTVTNTKGEFTLQIDQTTQASLLISSLGYTSETRTISFKTSSIGLGVIVLKKGVSDLEEVYIENDPWPRERKLAYFRKWFLGEDYKDKKTKILNEEEVQLRFISSSNTLVASSKVPLKVQNKYLSYLIEYDLMTFELSFKKVNFTKDGKKQTYYNEHSSYYAGTSFFKELKDKTRTKFLMRREETYEGSILHFMRSLASKELEENKFRTIHKKNEVPPYQYFDIIKTNNLTSVEILVQKLILLYDGFEQSFIQVDENSTTIYIDAYGNFSPINSLYFGGNMGKQKMSSLLPLNYKINPPKDE
ncbi:carboxypeptidase-like regulatory domain-containing protein [Mesonia sp.]|uniref:carboxypeptidase-like regulatory domain-containing protein n=1 Tax=Mesonia sp. TaxID=1960830 RepID=UPI003F9584D9